MSWKDIIKNPISWVAGTIASIGFLDPSLLIGFGEATWMNLGSLFTFTSIAGLTLPRYWPPESSAEWLLILIGIGFALKIGHGIWKTYDRELDEET